VIDMSVKMLVFRWAAKWKWNCRQYYQEWQRLPQWQKFVIFAFFQNCHF